MEITENGKIERVAKAIQAQDDSVFRWDHLARVAHERYFARARAAIEAMREPTEAQRLAMQDALLAIYPEIVDSVVVTDGALLKAIYTASIDAALTS